jgi:hypothetical protein
LCCLLRASLQPSPFLALDWNRISFMTEYSLSREKKPNNHNNNMRTRHDDMMTYIGTKLTRNNTNQHNNILFVSKDFEFLEAKTISVTITCSTLVLLVERLTLSQTNKQPNKQPTKQASKQANKQTSKQANKQTSKQTNKPTSNQANKQTSQQSNNQTSNQPTKQTSNQPSNQPGRSQSIIRQ